MFTNFLNFHSITLYKRHCTKLQKKILLKDFRVKGNWLKTQKQEKVIIKSIFHYTFYFPSGHSMFPPCDIIYQLPNKWNFETAPFCEYFIRRFCHSSLHGIKKKVKENISQRWKTFFFINICVLVVKKCFSTKFVILLLLGKALTFLQGRNLSHLEIKEDCGHFFSYCLVKFFLLDFKLSTANTQLNVEHWRSLL